MPRPRGVELVCPAGTPASLRTAVDAGADTVYCGLQNATNARNFPGLNFSAGELRSRSTTRMRGAARCCWRSILFRPPAIPALEGRRRAAPPRLAVDAIIVADMGVADLCQPRISAAAAASVGTGRRLVAGGDPLPLRGVQRQTRGAAAHPDRRRDRRHSPPDPLRDRGLRVRQYRHDGGRPLQPDQLCHGESRPTWTAYARRPPTSTTKRKPTAR